MSKFARIVYNGRATWVEIENNLYVYQLSGEPFTNGFIRGKRISTNIKNLEFLAPVKPSKVIGLGWNYKDLVGEKSLYDEPVIFLKSPTSICEHNSSIKYPAYANKVWVEVELVIVIGKVCSGVEVDDAQNYIFGYTLGSDITALNVANRDWHLARSKAIDQFAPIGSFLVSDLDTSNLQLKSYINSREAQIGNTKNRILNDYEIVSLVSSMMTLMPGDVIFTGTPAKATEAVVLPGDKVVHSIDKIGDLEFSII